MKWNMKGMLFESAYILLFVLLFASLVSAQDAEAPSVVIQGPSGSNIVYQGNGIAVFVDVTDNVAVDTVLIDFTSPSGIIISDVMLFNGVTYVVNFTTNSSTEPGAYTYLIIANDTSGNVNDTEIPFPIDQVHVFDVTNPSVTNVNADPSMISQGDGTTLSAIVTDNSGTIESITANVVLPNGTVVANGSNSTLAPQGGDTFSLVFSDTQQLGNYTVTIFSEDGDFNHNDSETTTFEVVAAGGGGDTVAPAVDAAVAGPPQFINPGDTIRIRVNVSDDFGVDGVFANMTPPNDPSFLVPMTLLAGTDYHFIFDFVTDFTTETGSWVVQIIANDTNGNVNNTESTNFFVDEVPVSVVDVTADPDNLQLGDTTTISADVGSNNTVTAVLANFSAPDGSSSVQPMSELLGVFSTNITPELEGVWTVTIMAYSNIGDFNGTEFTTFNVNGTNVTDVTAPAVANLAALPSFIDLAGILGQAVDISATVTDDVLVTASGITVDVVAPNGSLVETQGMFPNETADVFVATFTGVSWIGINNGREDILGNWTVTVVANDSSGNSNGTESVSFEVVDTEGPTVTQVLATPASAEPGTSILLSANITDNGPMGDRQFGQVTLPDGREEGFFLDRVPGSDIHAANFTNTSLEGNYTFLVGAVDVAVNVNDTESTTFEIVAAADVVNPSVTNIDAEPRIINQGDTSIVIVDVTDDVAVGTVLIDFTSPSGVVTQQTMVFNGVQYETDFVTDLFTEPGTYDYLIIVNDTSGNLNATEVPALGERILVNDVTSPSVTDVTAVPNNIAVGETTLISANITDNFQVDIARALVTRPDNTTQNLTLTDADGDGSYTVVATDTSQVGVYLVTIWARDVQVNGVNTNDTETTTFTVNAAPDTTPPMVNSVTITPQDPFVGDAVVISANVTDNSGVVDSVDIAFLLPNGGSVSWFLTDQGNDVFSETFEGLTNLPGNYSVMITAFDGSFNINETITLFTVSEAAPMVNSVTATLSEINQGETTTISANVSDDVALGTVFADFTSPSGATTLETMALEGGLFAVDFATTPLTEVGNWTAAIVAFDAAGNSNDTENVTFVVNPVVVMNMSNVTNGTIYINQSDVLFSCNASAINNLSIVGGNGVQVNVCNFQGGPQILIQNSVGSMNNVNVNTPGMNVIMVNGTLTLSNVGFGNGNGASVMFPNAVLSGDVVINDSVLDVTSTSASLDSSALPQLNTTATLTFPNVPFNNPRVVFNNGNGGGNQACQAPRCTNFNFTNRTVTVDVSEWSEYLLEETEEQQNNNVNNGGVSSGGGGGFRRAPVVTHAGPTCAVQMESLQCGAGSVPFCQFPSSQDAPYCRTVEVAQDATKPVVEAAEPVRKADLSESEQNVITGAFVGSPGGFSMFSVIAAVVLVLGASLVAFMTLRRK
jgi:hypothetical protein